VNVVVALLIDAVVTNEPVLIGVTFKANEAVTAFCACEALTAYEALVATLALLAFTTLFIVKGNVVASPLVNVMVAFVLDAVRTLFNANDAVVANDADTAEPVAIVTGNVEPSPLVNVIMLATALAVVNNEAVLTVEPAFKANEAVKAYDADVAILAVDALVAFVANELLVDTKAYEADVATLLYEALIACDAEVALSALEEVINKLPVIVVPKPVCSSLPLT
jgi:hypothetical protein